MAVESGVMHPDGTHCCCRSLEQLACAASCIHSQFCHCKDEGDTEGCACCEQSLELTLQAMEAHIACLRGVCRTTYAAAAKKATKKSK